MLFLILLLTPTGAAILGRGSPRNTTALVGASVTLHCEHTDQEVEDVVAVQWKRGSQVLAINNMTFIDARYSISSQYNLNIRNVTSNDSGTYYCEGKKNANAYLQIIDIKSGPTIRQVADNRFNCTITLDDPKVQPTFLWIADDKIVETGITQAFYIAEETGVSSSTITFSTSPTRSLTCTVDIGWLNNAATETMNLAAIAAAHSSAPSAPIPIRPIYILITIICNIVQIRGL